MEKIYKKERKMNKTYCVDCQKEIEYEGFCCPIRCCECEKKQIENSKPIYNMPDRRYVARQMGAYNSLTDEQKESYRALSVEITKSKNALKDMKSQVQALPGINLDSLKNGLKKVGEVAEEVTKKMFQHHLDFVQNQHKI